MGTLTEEDTRYKKHCTQDNDASIPFQVPWDLTQFSQSPSVAPWHFPESHWWFEISPLSKVILVLVPARSRRVPNLGCRGDKSPGWFDVLTKTVSDVTHEGAHCRDESNHRLPITAAFWIIRTVPTDECSSLMQNLMQNCCSPHAITLNATATQYTCSLNGIYSPHWPVHWCSHCSRMHIPIHSPWLQGCTNTAETVLVIIIIACYINNVNNRSLY